MHSCNCGDRGHSHFSDFFSENIYTWCTNCGNYGIHAAVKRALVDLEIKPCQTLLAFDIGCHGNGSDKIGGYRFHGLHGRVIPFACGASTANSKVKIIAFGGDGGTLGEGINHLVLGIRGNYDITFVLHNNLNYGLTLGQPSATTKQGVAMNAAPDGVTSEPIHPMKFIFSLGPTFAARTFSGDVGHMAQTFKAAIEHPGFSFVEVLQSCPTYNLMTPHEWYQERIKDVSQIKGHDAGDISQANSIALDIEKEIAVGVLYQNKKSIPFNLRQANRVNKKTALVDEVKNLSVEKLFDSFR